MIDVACDGFSLTSQEDGVVFNLAFPQQLAWTSTGGDDGWLALDRDGNSSIDNEQELFGNGTPQPPPPPGETRNGFLALYVFDGSDQGGNDNGFLDLGDAAFSSLRVWQDTNHNGVSEATELKPLVDAGICAIDLLYKVKQTVDEHGNVFYYRARTWDCTNHQRGWAWDVFLVGRAEQ